MRLYITYDPAGNITSVGTNVTGLCVGDEEPVSYKTHYVLDGAVHRYTQAEIDTRQSPPSSLHVWSVRSKSWVDPRTASEILEASRAARWEVIKAAREAHEFGGFVWDGSAFDSDGISQSRIQGALQLATLAGPDFATVWTLRDNTQRRLTAADLAQVGVALGKHVASSHAHARELRAAIDTAADPDIVNAINW